MQCPNSVWRYMPPTPLVSPQFNVNEDELAAAHAMLTEKSVGKSVRELDFWLARLRRLVYNHQNNMNKDGLIAAFKQTCD